MRLTAILAGWFLGLVSHLRSAQGAAVRGESMFWLWTKRPASRVEAWSRYTFYVWLASTFLLILPINLKVAIGIQGVLLFVHVMTFTFRFD